MASLKEIRKRIVSVKNTQKITRAMKMVAAAKLRRAQDAATSARPYAEKLSGLLESVSSRVEGAAHPLLEEHEEVRSIHLVLVTADRGLCGGYNSNLIRQAEEFIAEKGKEKVRLTLVGRRGFDYFKRRGANIADQHINLPAGPDHHLAEALSRHLQDEYMQGTSDAVFLLYNAFRSALVQTPTLQQLLPIQANKDEESVGTIEGGEYLYEPQEAQLLGSLIERYVSVLIHRSFLEAVASEHGARMTAMDSATTNASEMIDKLTLDMNRARQAGITKELMEIVGGAEALSG